MNGVTLITPTGGRQEAFALCEKFMNRQDYTGPTQWLVIDDCIPQTIVTMGQDLIHPLPSWQPGQNTQVRNLLAAIPHIKYDILLFIEDDDYYRHDYITRMLRYFHSGRSFLVGETSSHYFHARARYTKVFTNMRHSSLCATGLRTERLDLLQSAIATRLQCLDMPLWQRCFGKPGVGLHPYSGACIGIKGMPGRAGITGAHQQLMRGWFPDPNMDTFRSWVGAEDAALYESFQRG